MKEIGRPETIAASRAQGWIAKVSSRLAHTNKYGAAVRLEGWTGPVIEHFATLAEAEASIAAWVSEDPATRCGFVCWRRGFPMSDFDDGLCVAPGCRERALGMVDYCWNHMHLDPWPSEAEAMRIADRDHERQQELACADADREAQ